jgi:hypothetical protein
MGRFVERASLVNVSGCRDAKGQRRARLTCVNRSIFDGKFSLLRSIVPLMISDFVKQKDRVGHDDQ